jgi:hypothetical protein
VLAVLTAVPAPLAQGTVPPFVLQVTNPHPNLSAPVIPVSGVAQIQLIHLPGDPPNIYSACMTVYGLGVGAEDLLCGSYDVLTDTLTTNNDAAALNTTGTDFGLMQHHTGLFAVFDRLPGPPHLATRTAVGQPWVDFGPIGGLPSQSYYDPALADYQGQPHLLHVLGVNIAMSPIDLTTGQLTGPSVVIASAARAGSTANSPTPIVGPNGELIGISHHDVLGADNDHYISLDLDFNTPALLVNDTTTWTNNGGYIGGRFFDAESSPAPYHVLSFDTYWCTGGRASVGDTIHVAFHVPPAMPPTHVHLSAMLLANDFAPPITVPGIQGQLGLQLSSVFWPGQLLLHDNTTGTASLAIAVPPVPAFSGIQFAMQSVTTDVMSNTFTFGNTARFAID